MLERLFVPLQTFGVVLFHVVNRALHRRRAREFLIDRESAIDFGVGALEVAVIRELLRVHDVLDEIAGDVAVVGGFFEIDGDRGRDRAEARARHEQTFAAETGLFENHFEVFDGVRIDVDRRDEFFLGDFERGFAELHAVLTSCGLKENVRARRRRAHDVLRRTTGQRENKTRQNEKKSFGSHGFLIGGHPRHGESPETNLDSFPTDIGSSVEVSLPIRKTVKLNFDPLPFLIAYFQDSENPNPALEDVLSAIAVVRAGLDSPTDWSDRAFMNFCLDPATGLLKIDELRTAVDRCLNESVWLRDRLPSPRGRSSSGQRRFLDKALALPELKRLARTLRDDNPDPARVTKELDRLTSIPTLDYVVDEAVIPIHQPAMILRHALAQRLLVRHLQTQGLDKTLAALHAKWETVEQTLPSSSDLRDEMIKLIRQAYEDKHDAISVQADGRRSWSVLGDLGEILGWLHEGPRGYELRDEWGLPVAFHVRRAGAARGELVDTMGLPL